MSDTPSKGGGGKKGRKMPPPFLSAMRAVANQAEEKDDGELQKNCRALLKEDRTAFFRQLAAAEKDFTSAKSSGGAAADGGAPGAPAGEEEPIADAASERVEDLATQLLDAYDREKGK